MPRSRARRAATPAVLHKTPTGIPGFDAVTYGGLPRGRTALVCGTAGCGKTLFGMQFLVRGALDHGEPGVFLAFEETPDDLAKNVSSLGFDLADLERRKLLSVDHVRIERSEIEESGAYDLEGLFVRLELAIRSVGAKRVVIDTLETLFGELTNAAILRSELRRLFLWLKERGVTSVVTAERGEGGLTRHGLEEYVSDCVILLDHRVNNQVSTRRLRVVKYRGSLHGTNEYPFLIDEHGIHVAPITSSGLQHAVSNERVSSGIERLDRMLGGAGYYRGSTILVSGSAGTGKTSVCGHFAEATCERGERCLYFAFEESPAQLERNLASIGIDLSRHVKSGRLRFEATRATTFGLETHLAMMHKAVAQFQPHAVVVDPVGTLISAGSRDEAHLMLVRLIDHLKSRGITALLASLVGGGETVEKTEVEISSIVDTWIVLKALEANGERNRGIHVLKSRGMAHSNQIREFLITDDGLRLLDVYVGAEGILTGSARLQQAARERADRLQRSQDVARMRRDVDHRRMLLEQQITALRAGFDKEVADLESSIREHDAREDQFVVDREEQARSRRADAAAPRGNGAGRGLKTRRA